jgi:hypothetical protein
MRNAQVAEWILSLVTTPERAAATVGDLLENAASRSRFWFGVWRTAFSLLWRDFSGDPARMMSLAFRGFLFRFSILFVLVVVLFIAIVFMGFLAGLFGHPTDITDVAIHPIVNAVGEVLSVGLSIVVSFKAGRWMARRSPGRELAPVVAFTILGLVFATVGGLIGHFILRLVSGFAWNALLEIPTFAGAVWVRRQRLSH